MNQKIEWRIPAARYLIKSDDDALLDLRAIAGDLFEPGHPPVGVYPARPGKLWLRDGKI